MLHYRASHVAAGYNDTIIVAGGYDDTEVLTSAEKYDPVSNTWTYITNMPVAKAGAGYTLYNGKLYVSGGWNSSWDITKTVHVYDPTANTWEQISDMKTARLYHTSLDTMVMCLL